MTFAKHSCTELFLQFWAFAMYYFLAVGGSTWEERLKSPFAIMSHVQCTTSWKMTQWYKIMKLIITKVYSRGFWVLYSLSCIYPHNSTQQSIALLVVFWVVRNSGKDAKWAIELSTARTRYSTKHGQSQSFLLWTLADSCQDSKRLNRLRAVIVFQFQKDFKWNLRLV